MTDLNKRCLLKAGALPRPHSAALVGCGKKEEARAAGRAPAAAPAARAGARRPSR